MKKHFLFVLALSPFFAASAFALTGDELLECAGIQEYAEVNFAAMKRTTEIFNEATATKVLRKYSERVAEITEASPTCEAALDRLENTTEKLTRILDKMETERRIRSIGRKIQYL